MTGQILDILLSPLFALYLAMTAVVCLTPGPNVMLVVSLGLRQGRTAVAQGVTGIVTASCVYLLVSALGLVAAFRASATAFAVVRYVGAAYLVYVGLRLLLGALRRSLDVAVPAPPRARAAFWQGVVTHLSNPKAMLFWSALLPQFIDPARSVTLQIVLLGAVGITIDAIVQLGYGWVAAAASHASPSGRFQRWVNLAAGVLLTATGVLLASQGA